tara:strand:- start:66 stop:950 length:885 start_codon:yes stop_codon:yes gene_type:complete
MSKREPPLQLLTYDSRSALRKGVYASVEKLGLPLQVGSLEDAAERRYRSADKPSWLLRTLPRMQRDGLVMMLDASDMHVLCGATEIVSKWRELTRGDENTVIVGGEPILWPDQQRFDGRLLARSAGPYPQPVPTSSPLKWINCGLLLGTTDAVFRLLACMRDRFAGFPDACPADVTSDGRHPTNYSDATRYVYSKSIVFTRGGWGWDQACYHAYVLEQAAGLLPRPQCPKLLVDYRADVVLSLGGQARKLDWHAAPGRIGYNVTGARPCVLHGNGVKGKPLFQKVQRWWRKHVA